MKLRQFITVLFIGFFALTSVSVHAQEEDPFLPYRVAPQNLLKFNRFLINPTFSTVREDKSYVNLLHRNQSVDFQNNDQTYFLSYSGRMGDKSGLGLSLYSQKLGPISNIGVLANYAYGIKLSDKSNFTFGGNLAYYSTGLNLNSVDVVDQNDFRLRGAEDSNILSFQPGFNISYDKFDFGVFAENLFDYNITSSQTITEFSEKSYSAHLQYTHQFKNTTGIFESARLMPMARVKLNGQNDLTGEIEQDLSLGGSLILDLPKIGWLQGGYDGIYGASVGAGFNLNKRLSLGYTMEKGYGTDLSNFGVTHEISFAYSFTPNLTEDRVMLEDNDDELVENSELNTDDLATNDEIEKLKKKLAENDAILAELMFRQDSIESGRKKDLERRFEMVMRMVRNETNGERPDLEKRAENMFLDGREKPTTLASNSSSDGIESNSTQNNTQEIKYNTQDPKTNTVNALAANNRTKNISNSTQNNTEEVAYNTQEPKTNTTDALAVNNITSRNIPNSTQNNTEEVAYNTQEPKTNTADALAVNNITSRNIPNSTQNNTEEVAYNTQEPKTNTADALAVNNITSRNMPNSTQNNTEEVAYNTQESERSNVILQDKTRNVASNTIKHDAIKSRKFKNLEGVEDGYYVVANVYKGGKYMNNFIDSMNDKGFDSNYIENPTNGLKYVYLERYDTWQEASDAYKSNMNGAYTDDLWVMNVDNRYTNEAYASNVNKLKQRTTKYKTNALQQNVIANDKLVANSVPEKTYKIDGVGSGYYIVANVFANPNNAKRFIKLLNSYGLSASYFINPENNWRYVYLKRHESWNNALISYYSKLNDSYDDKMWVMRVKQNYAA